MTEKTFTLATTPPKRQGFYTVRTNEGMTLIAEWREYDKRVGKRWWQRVGEDATAEKHPVLLLGVVEWSAALQVDVDASLRRQLTEAEQIEKAIRAQTDRDLFSFHPLTPPAHRTLAIGDAVELGNLKDCKVVALRDKGCIVVLSFHNLRQRSDTLEDFGTGYLAVHWTRVVNKATCEATRLVHEPLMFDGFRSSMVESLLSRCLRGLEDNPCYQRGYVWTAEDKARYLESLFAGRDLGRFVFVACEYPAKDEILDGKQRLSCLWDFFTSQLSFQGVFWHQLSSRDRDQFESRSIQYVDLPGTRYTKADLLRIFLEINAGGVPQTEAHLQAVREQLKQELSRQAA